MGVALPILKAGQKSLRKSPGRVGCARAERLATESHHRSKSPEGFTPAGRLADTMGTQWMGRLVL